MAGTLEYARAGWVPMSMAEDILPSIRIMPPYSQNKLISRQWRHLDKLQQHDYDVKYFPAANDMWLPMHSAISHIQCTHPSSIIPRLINKVELCISASEEWLTMYEGIPGRLDIATTGLPATSFPMPCASDALGRLAVMVAGRRWHASAT